MTAFKETLKWILLLGLVGFVIKAVFIDGTQQGLTPSEFADLDTVKVLHTYRVEERFAGLAYYDKATNTVCHVVTDATLLNPKAIDCAPYRDKQK